MLEHRKTQWKNVTLTAITLNYEIATKNVRVRARKTVTLIEGVWEVCKKQIINILTKISVRELEHNK